MEAGAEVVKLFDSWAGSLSAPDFGPVCLEPNRRIISELKSRFPNLPVIAFPRGAGGAYERFVAESGADCVGLDQHVPLDWARERLQPKICVQGNLDPMLMVEGGEKLDRAAKTICETLGDGPFVFNLGHGITPDADPANVERLLRAVRG